MSIRQARIVGVFSSFLSVAIVLVSAHLGWAQSRDGHPTPPPPPPPRSGDNDRSPTTRPKVAAPATRPLSPLAPGEKRFAIQFTEGHETDPRDHGRPVTLIAAALKVPENVFRETFSHVHPAGPGSGGPTDTEARQNKQALMAGLSPYGVTDDRINAVSNYYRYMKHNHDDLWQHRNAAAYAVVKNNKVIRFDLVDPGAGYTTPPTAAIENLPDVNVMAKLEFGTDLVTNGSIKSLKVALSATAPSR